MPGSAGALCWARVGAVILVMHSGHWPLCPLPIPEFSQLDLGGPASEVPGSKGPGKWDEEAKGTERPRERMKNGALATRQHVPWGRLQVSGFRDCARAWEIMGLLVQFCGQAPLALSPSECSASPARL